MSCETNEGHIKKGEAPKLPAGYIDQDIWGNPVLKPGEVVKIGLPNSGPESYTQEPSTSVETSSHASTGNMDYIYW